MKKDVIYVDVDDEITEVTSKVIESKGKIVALVLPKRCNLLHSAVNMKILKKTASSNNKNLVLITSEKALLPLAATARMFVAKTLQSKPAVPALAEKTEPEIPQEIGDEPVLDESKSIGELAGDKEPAEEEATDKPIELGEDSEIEDKVQQKVKEPKKDKKLKVPNFDSFRLKLFLGAFALVLLIVGIYFAMFVLPRAEITITTENKTIPVSVEITAQKSITSDDIANSKFVLQTKTIEKTDTKKVATTGTKNIGTKATGTITIYNCEYNGGFTLPAGTIFTTGFSGGTASFISTERVDVPDFTGSVNSCKTSSPFTNSGKATVNVTAASPGGAYNLNSGRSYSISGISGSVSAIGGAMGGGEDKTVKIVSDEDCTNAKNELLNTKSDDYKNQLTSQFESAGLAASKDTFNAETVKVGCTPAVDSEATEVTATATFKYTMAGVSSGALNQLLQNKALELAGSGQTVTDTGLSKASITIKERKANGDIVFAVQTQAKTGLKQDSATISESIKGKNARVTSETIKALPGVKDVTVKYSPFWVSKNPSNVKNIKIVFVISSNGSQ